MDFSRLPDNAFLQIIEYLPLEECIRVRRVSKPFRRISQLAISRTKYLNLGEDRFRNLTPDQLAVMLDLCSSNLKQFNIGGNPDQYQQFATIFAHFQCPRLTDINLGDTPIDRSVFQQLIRNCPNMESLLWLKEFVGFPAMTNKNLKKLRLIISSNASLETLIGHCPNLEEIVLSAGIGITATVLDQFFSSIPHVHRINITLAAKSLKLEQAEMVNFYKLPLTHLKIHFYWPNTAGYFLLSKVATSFPRLQELKLGLLKPTNQGIALLAALRDLQVLQLVLVDNGESYDQGFWQFARCKKLRKLDGSLSDMTGGTLVNLLRSCPRLEYVAIYDMTEVDSPDEAVGILDSLAGITKRGITISFYSPSENFESIWEGKETKKAIKKLEEDDGLKIKIEKD